MTEARKADSALDEKYCERRKDQVQGTKLFHDQVPNPENKKRVVAESEKTFQEEKVEGTFQPLGDFARQRGLMHLDFHELIEHAENKLKLTVTQNKRDDWGVEIMDYNDGSYRFSRGVRDEVERSKEEIQTSKAKDSNFHIWLCMGAQ